MIKEIDEKVSTLSTQVRQDVDRCLNLVPQSSWKSPNGEQYKEVAELRSTIESRQQMLVQLAEEKVQLAIQSYELVDQHLSILNSNMKEFAEEEAQANAAENDDIAPVILPSSVEPAPMPPLPRRPSGSYMQGSKKQAEKKTGGEKRVRDRERDPELIPKTPKRANSQQQLMPITDTLETPIASELPKPDGRQQSAIAGLKAAAPNLQALGRLLTHVDITPELRGRHAELFWPEDNLWYVITIHEVNPATKTAQIMYTTGETEELDLNEIVRDRHMSIINR
eukprot:CAMPEP_0117655924 /NCGR_PEP_ID=MMETSP0804-20121206/4533_1 /TAXON_ID=1074897 /ORGANISM="Tetraselmis astigmatica, Strain CCMP880" /LENGTH=280 /DNA_ID=CAMNT_0005462297 /DNA_START=44 /DNA_END=886 /DNA_ORIENTATION=+